MDSIVTMALVGTANQGPVSPTTDTPVDGLIEGLPRIETERKLLLSAGAWSVYRQAGFKPEHMATLPEAAGPEKLRSCSPKIAQLFERLLLAGERAGGPSGEREEVLIEALERAHKAQVYLPHKLLVQALNSTSPNVRAALFPLLGERGLWLSTFNKRWQWVRDYLPDDSQVLPSDIETIWQEGTAAQRAEVLRRMRASDAATALTQLQSVWKQERAEVRTTFLEALTVGLNLADEPFLEDALDDRAAGVRQVAADLLAKLPGSAYLQRMSDRAQTMLSIKDGHLHVELPATTIPKDWVRDCIVEEPPAKASRRIWWLRQVIRRVSPEFWETHLNAGPEALIEMAGTDEKWRRTVLGSWSEAAIHFNVQNWLMPLWQWWNGTQEASGEQDESAFELRKDLLACLPAQQAESLVLNLLADEQKWSEAASLGLCIVLPRPWSEEYSLACLKLMRERCLSRVYAHSTLKKDTQAQFNPYSDEWFMGLLTVALAIAPACLAEARQGWDLPEPEGGQDWQFQYAKRQIHAFTDLIKLRQRIYKEIF